MSVGSKNIPIIIPAYEPDKNLTDFLRTLPLGHEMVVLVDDGSGDDYASVFSEAKDILGESGIVLKHEVNKGKGAALKTAFRYILSDYPDKDKVIGVVTADSDGQHTVPCVNAVMDALIENPSSLIMGVRAFGGENIPWKSRVGNVITIKVMKLLAGISVSDTQTGLRGIPIDFMRELLLIKSDRFEFETEMLIDSKGKYEITEVPIETIYDSKENHSTHFNPFKDSLRIYSVILGRFFKFMISSLSSSLIDLLIFTLLCKPLVSLYPVAYTAIATVIARVISASYNCAVNYKIVFKSKEKVSRAVIKYVILAICQMSLSALCVTLLNQIFNGVYPTILKVIVDIILFFISYRIQHRFVFNAS